MLTEIHFIIPGEPVGKARPRVVRTGNFTRAYTPKKTADYEATVRGSFLETSKGDKFEEGVALYAKVSAYFGIPKSTTKKRREKMLAGEIEPTKKPDIDNILKAIFDACQPDLLKDDSYIVDVVARKHYSDRPRVEVDIAKIRQFA